MAAKRQGVLLYSARDKDKAIAKQVNLFSLSLSLLALLYFFFTSAVYVNIILMSLDNTWSSSKETPQRNFTSVEATLE
ncbi:uncharacterized protein BJX67DRAFT_348325 [Aspergillus lucknowensis]|uniref:Uncharacterized protein n=1 Tax=Aspergillus lucknowensis TaxID=176173 RepID=A0ABR4LZW6_9EURO